MSRMTIGLLSEEGVEPISDAEVAQTNLDQTKVEAQAEAIDTLKAAGQGAEEVAEQLQAAPEGPAGEEAEKIAEVALEAFRRIGLINQKERPAMESGRGKRQDLIRELKYVGRRNAQGISVAQEGFFADLGYSLRKTFTTWDGLTSRRTSAEQAFDQKGSNGDLMVDKPYAAWLNPNSKQTLKGSDVQEILKFMISRLRSEDLIEAMSQMASVAHDVVDATSGWFVNDKDRAKIEEAAEEVGRISKNFMREALTTSKVGHKAVIQACTADDRSSIEKLNLSAIISPEFVAEHQSLSQAVLKYQSSGSWSLPGVNGEISKSLTVDHVMRMAWDTLNRIGLMFNCMFNLLFAYTRWIEDSTQK